MAVTKHLVLAFCTDNQQAADEITTDLARVGYILQPKGFSNDLSSGTIGEALDQTKDHVILLVTDNFLKSAGCLEGLLATSQKLVREERLIPVIADGRIPRPDGNGWDAIPTTFERVSNVIHYMNNWQDKYLDLRREIRHKEDDKELEERLEVTRKISSEIGEFLRLLRNQKYIPLPDFQANSYEVFFQLRNDPDDHKELMEMMSAANTPGKTKPKKDDKQLIEFIQSSSEELMAENLELDKHHEDETMSTEELMAIPGMEVLIEKESEESLRDDFGEDDDEAEVAGDRSHYAETDEAEAKIPQAANETSFEELPDLNKTAADPVDALLEEIIAEDEEVEVDIEVIDEDEMAMDIEDIFEEEPQEETPQAGSATRQVSTTAKNRRLPTAEEALEIAIKLFEEGQKDQGIGFLQGAVEGRPKDPALRYYYAYALARYAHNFPEATKELKTLLQFDEEYADAWYLLAELAEIRQDYPGAIAHFEKTASIKADYPDVFYRIALIALHHLEGQEGRAAEYFQKALRQDKKNPDAHYRLATILSDHLHRPQEAIKHFKKALKYYPGHPFANYDLALVYHKLGEMKEAVTFYNKATGINPELKTPHNDVAFGLLAFDEMGQPAKTAEVAEGQKFGAGQTVVDPDDSNEFAQMEEEYENSTALETFENITGAPEALAVQDTSEQGALPATEPAVQPISPPAEGPKTILISGATAGIGLATAEIFAKNGYRVIITGRREERLRAIEEGLHENYGAEVWPLNFDVRNIYEVKKAIESLPEEWAKVDILVNNAGLSRGLAPIHEGETEHWDAMIDTNIKGLLYLTRAVSPHMVARRSGHIINVASGAGKEVYPSGNVYCATKFAVDSLTKAMRLDLYKHNIRVSQVAPGHVEETEFARVRFDWDEQKAAQVYDSFQPLRPGDVAEAIYFIATRPPHVNIQDILLFGTQQAGSNFIDRSGR